jgi:protein-disulfide isomerase
MFKSIGLTIVITLAATGLAQAACPSRVPGSTPEAIAINQQRILCLQEEVRQAGQQQNYNIQLQGMQNTIRDIQLQQRLDSLPKITVPVFQQNPALPRN